MLLQRIINSEIMESYLYQVHNLTGNTKFSRLSPDTKSAILTILQDSFSNLNHLEKAIADESSDEVLSFIKQHLDIRKNYRNIVFTTKKRSFTEEDDVKNLKAIIDFKKVNNIRYVNELFKAVNSYLPNGGLYIGRLETYWERKLMIYSKFGRQIGRILWLGDFVINRIIPRIPYLEDLYYNITKCEFHSMSRAEALGRLIYCGFDIVDFVVIKGLSYFVAFKAKEPGEFEHPSYYPIIKLQRIGKNAKPINVYKFRTMHPYSEYLQDYVIKHYGYNDKGKPANDFRLTRWGKFMRKLWLDELPQLINVLKGEMKIVGIRPISKRFLDEYPEDVMQMRTKQKPGCIPPYVAHLSQEVDSYIASERRYLIERELAPVKTDLKIFFQAVYNILSNKIRSK